MLARDLPKLHGEDPSGFWKLVRTGKELPVVGQQVLYVYDIRGTESELRHRLLMGVAAGNPYRITDETPNSMPRAVKALNAEMFKLPVHEFEPQTFVGVVFEVGFDEILQEHWIGMQGGRSVWGRHHASEHIVYWAPMPTPADTYAPREGDLADLYYTDGMYQRESRERDALATPVDED